MIVTLALFGCTERTGTRSEVAESPRSPGPESSVGMALAGAIPAAADRGLVVIANDLTRAEAELKAYFAAIGHPLPPADFLAEVTRTLRIDGAFQPEKGVAYVVADWNDPGQVPERSAFLLPVSDTSRALERLQAKPRGDFFTYTPEGSARPLSILVKEGIVIIGPDEAFLGEFRSPRETFASRITPGRRALMGTSDVWLHLGRGVLARIEPASREAWRKLGTLPPTEKREEALDEFIPAVVGRMSGIAKDIADQAESAAIGFSFAEGRARLRVHLAFAPGGSMRTLWAGRKPGRSQLLDGLPVRSYLFVGGWDGALIRDYWDGLGRFVLDRPILKRILGAGTTDRLRADLEVIARHIRGVQLGVGTDGRGRVNLGRSFFDSPAAARDAAERTTRLQRDILRSALGGAFPIAVDIESARRRVGGLEVDELRMGGPDAPALVQNSAIGDAAVFATSDEMTDPIRLMATGGRLPEAWLRVESLLPASPMFIALADPAGLIGVASPDADQGPGPSRGEPIGLALAGDAEGLVIGLVMPATGVKVLIRAAEARGFSADAAKRPPVVPESTPPDPSPRMPERPKPPPPPPAWVASKTSFFGVEAEGKSFVFVIDVSGSMSLAKSLDYVKRELAASLDAIGPGTGFRVILYNHSATELPAGPKGLIAANPPNLRQAREELSTIQAGGGTDLRNALHSALALKPAVVYLLTDDDIGNDWLPLGAELAAALGTSVHLIEIGDFDFGAGKESRRQAGFGVGANRYRFLERKFFGRPPNSGNRSR